jgi:hypothetical protein
VIFIALVNPRENGSHLLLDNFSEFLSLFLCEAVLLGEKFDYLVWVISLENY